MKTSKTLADAVIDKVRSTHWIKGGWRRTKRGKVCGCILGLVNMEYGYEASERKGFDGKTPRAKLAQAIAAVICHRYSHRAKPFCSRNPVKVITKFNDHQKTTRGEVLLVLEEAKKKLA